MTVPAEVLAEWHRKANDLAELEARQLQHHIANDHRHPFGPDCWMCGRARARCRGKVRYPTLEDALARVDAVNHPTRDRLLIAYRCYWSPGLHFHLATAFGASKIRRARKRMARLAVRP